MADKAQLVKILEDGALRANQMASKTLKAAYSAIGLT
jgi:hypothetical protein